VPSIDMPLDELRNYRPALTWQDDFDAFWTETVNAGKAQPMKAVLNPLCYPAEGVELFEVRLDAFGGGVMACRLMKPIGGTSLPTLVFYHGYSGSGPSPFQMLPWALQGYAVLSVDCRGQGGNSTDGAIYPGGHRPGFMTQGIEDCRQYYYRYVYGDCLRALDWMAEQPFVDPRRIAITGISQGGGITLAVAALSERPRIAISEVPYLCHFRRSVEISTAGPYREIADWMRYRPDSIEASWKTLSYFDGMNLAPRIRCKTVVTVGLWDDVCPPSGVFAAYNHIQGDKQLLVFEFTGHESPTHFADTRFEILRAQL